MLYLLVHFFVVEISRNYKSIIWIFNLLKLLINKHQQLGEEKKKEVNVDELKYQIYQYLTQYVIGGEINSISKEILSSTFMPEKDLEMLFKVRILFWNTDDTDLHWF